ncbi:hypothetical protein U1763_03400 [Sphingomonas sp. LB2R24]
MIDRRPFDSLGGANHGWLDAKHHLILDVGCCKWATASKRSRRRK